MIQETATSLPTALVIAPTLGAPSEVWMWRQLRAFRAVRPHVVCWRREGAREFPLPEAPVTIVGTPFEDRTRARRMHRRLRNLSPRNFMGTTGTERTRLTELLLEARPAMVLAHFGHTALRLLPVTRELGVPLVAHFHGMDCSSMLRNRWYRWSLQRCLGELDAIVVVGRHQKERLAGLGADPERIAVIPCGVPTGAGPLRWSFADARDGLRVLTVGRLVEFKGVAETIHAFSLVARGNDELAVVGAGPDRPELDALATRLGVRGRVRFRGTLPPDGVRAELARAHVLVQHSLDGANGACEGFGVAAAEAAAAGLPVVATRCGGLVDQVVHDVTGLLVDQRDIGATAAALDRLRQPALAARLGRAGRMRMVTGFDLARMVEHLEQVLLRAAGIRTAETVGPPVPLETPPHDTPWRIAA